MKNFIYLIAFYLLYTGCSKNEVQVALDYAGTNRAELEKVLAYYKDPKDSLKLRAACFLIANMPYHGYLWSERQEMYRKKIAAGGRVLGRGILRKFWEESQMPDEQEFVLDAHSLTSDFLIRNIESAFRVWELSPWREKVDYNTFCHYILPYRLADEPLSISWRDSLNLHFSPIIEKETDMQRAFVLISKYVNKKMSQSSVACPHVMDILSLNKYGYGLCRDRSLLLGNALRAVGIPAVYDYVHSWANYSEVGHTWIALPYQGKTYTLLDKDSVLRTGNRIDASMFKPTHILESDYPFVIDSIKRVSKVWRSIYRFSWEEDPSFLKYIPWNLANPFSVDVSDKYALTSSVSIVSLTKAKVAYLCTFRTGRDWQLAAWAPRERNGFTFRNVGHSIVYQLVELNAGVLTPLGYPFILRIDGRKVILKPDLQTKQKVLLHRKYRFFTHWTNQWGKMLQGRFEGSHSSDFKHAKILYTIRSTPLFQNIVELNTDEKFKYIRYVCPTDCRTPLAEIEFWSDGQRLLGKVVGEKATALENCFDSDMQTCPSCKQTGYWVGLALESPKYIQKIVYYPKNDDNFIQLRQEYELLYYDHKWISLGRRIATNMSLEYDSVPERSLLLLRNRTKGKEERIFIYEGGRQVWM
ncbi:hypothetical protein [Bacteroides reticulotermitis]|uniref:hypothetical protein n=1 Tax=Bacteroides reticulotermitis TaxID=1133319 RepID=UPI003A839AA6